jgi:hypothetical protein
VSPLCMRLQGTKSESQPCTFRAIALGSIPCGWEGRDVLRQLEQWIRHGVGPGRVGGETGAVCRCVWRLTSVWSRSCSPSSLWQRRIVNHVARVCTLTGSTCSHRRPRSRTSAADRTRGLAADRDVGEVVKPRCYPGATPRTPLLRLLRTARPCPFGRHAVHPQAHAGAFSAFGAQATAPQRSNPPIPSQLIVGLQVERLPPPRSPTAASVRDRRVSRHTAPSTVHAAAAPHHLIAGAHV